MRHPLKVSDVMTREVITVTEDTPYKEVVSLLATHHISAVPVLNRYGGIGGVVSETDLLRKEEFRRRPSPWLLRWWGSATRSKAAGARAGEVMSHPAVTIAETATIPDAARLLAARGITRLVVTTADGEVLAGIVTRSDLLKAFLEPDDRILQRIRRDVVVHALWDDPFGIEITVHDGVVTLSGEVDQRSTAAVAAKLTREIDGVVDVDNQLTWVYDDLAATPNPQPSPESRRRP
ncbi:CBS domain-containing protein [Kribbella solani]|uniref:CBS-domain-containing membrane protein n=1 Tax=Kribbella solani TaxID=236067 RepID=A0A841DJ01_9ACTN|nr:CBS domain-containing protein [Kribbella solani]MBB5978482.1 CBS-domain-containing membrane protein [Kribbella solani]